MARKIAAAKEDGRVSGFKQGHVSGQNQVLALLENSRNLVEKKIEVMKQERDGLLRRTEELWNAIRLLDEVRIHDNEIINHFKGKKD